MPYYYEGVANSEEEDKIQHEAFYNAVEKSTKQLGKNSRIMTKEQYNEIIEALSTVPRSTMTANQIRASYPSYYNWRNAYHIHTSNGKSILLKKEGKNKDDTVPVSLESMQQVVPYEHLFGFLMQHHRPDHCRGRTFHDRCSKASSNITRAVTQLFTDTCCRCIEQIKRKKPTAGHQPILTYGFGARGQVDMVDMQSMPDGEFKFLLDYTDHGNKLGYSIAMTTKAEVGANKMCMSYWCVAQAICGTWRNSSSRS